MPAIHHRIGTTAPTTDVLASLTTLDGLAAWWTTDTTGDPAPGGKITFTFGGPDRFFTMEVLTAERRGADGSAERRGADGSGTPERVEWRVVDGPAEWIGTTVTFVLERDAADTETEILFTHDGWREVVPFMHHCSTKWGIYLMSLRAVLEGGVGAAPGSAGVGRPWPDDVKASAFD